MPYSLRDRSRSLDLRCGRTIGLCLAALTAAAWMAVGCGPPSDAGFGARNADAAGENGADDIRPTQVVTHTVARGPIASLLHTNGRLTSARQASLVAKAAGVVVAVRAEPGYRVTAVAPPSEDPLADPMDDPATLVVLDRREATIAYKDAQLSVTQAEAALRQLKDNATRKTTEAERARRLYDAREGGIGVYSRDEVEALEIAAEQARLDEEVGRLAIDLARNDLAVAARALRDTVIRAPFPGVVLTGEPRVGQWMASGTIVFEFADDNALELVVSVTVAEAERCAVGQSVLVTSRSNATYAYPARVAAVLQAVEEETGLVRVRIQIIPAAPVQAFVTWSRMQELSRALSMGLGPVVPMFGLASAERLRIGMFVTAAISTAQHEDAILLPIGALRIRQEQTFVDAIDAEGRLSRRQISVNTRFRDRTRVEVAQGLAAGDRVIVSPTGLREGTRVGDAAEVAAWVAANPEETPADASMISARGGGGRGGMSGFGGWGGFGRDTGPTKVRVAPIEQSSVAALMRATGRLRSPLDVEVPAEASGDILNLPVAEGLWVRKGDVVAEFERRDLDLELSRARISLKQRQAEENKATVTLERARTDYERAQTLKDERGRPIFSPDEVDLRRNTFEQAVGDSEIATVRRRQAEVALERAELNVARASVRSPIDGYLVARPVRVGEQVSAGTIVAHVIDPRDLEIQFQVTEAEASRVRLGQPVTVASRGAVTSIYPATVSRIAPGIEPTNGLVTVTVRLLPWEGVQALAVAGNMSTLARLLGPGAGAAPTFPFASFATSPPLRVGDFVGLEVAVAVHARAVLVPKAALQFDGDQAYCFVASPGGEASGEGFIAGTARRMNVTVDQRFSTDTHVEVIASEPWVDPNAARWSSMRGSAGGGSTRGGSESGSSASAGGNRPSGAGSERPSGNSAGGGRPANASGAPTNASANANASARTGGQRPSGGSGAPGTGAGRPGAGAGDAPGATRSRGLMPGDLVVIRQSDLRSGAAIEWIVED